MRTTSPSFGCFFTPVSRLSGTMIGVHPPKKAKACTWQRSHASCFMSSVGSTWEYLLNGRAATKRYTFGASPDMGPTSCIVGPARSASSVLPALWPTLLTTLRRSAYCFR